MEAARRALLDTDLRQVGQAALPEDVNRADSKKLAGPLVLQVGADGDGGWNVDAWRVLLLRSSLPAPHSLKDCSSRES